MKKRTETLNRHSVGLRSSFLKDIFENQRGVNVIEFLLIVAIIIVMALAIIPNINLFLGTDKKIADANVEALNIKSAAVAYEANENKFPPDSDVLVNGNYIAEPRAYYTFDIGTGRILNATVDTIGHLPANPWSGIRWDYNTGSWVKQ
jgi:competence protein ComGC